ncbi:MAG: hypothetical protein ABSG68_03610 [Thermoguttaceae bacterium]|jgi:hypothetical protein
MMTRKNEKAEYGDFQTPPALARTVCSLLAEHGLKAAALLEPTCGRGSLLFAGLEQFPEIQRAIGADISADYIEQARALLLQRPDAKKADLVHGDFFVMDWERLISELPEPILVLGNPPWVTNAHLGTLGSRNLPVKENFQRHSGLDAITGKANFDISEWMLIHLLEALNGRRGTLAMLCKATTARKTLQYAWKKGLALEHPAIYGIDAELHFGAAVDAVLLVAHLRPGAHSREAKVYRQMRETSTDKMIGYEDGVLLADIASYHQWKHLCGDGTLKWRSGIKHDCARIMELQREGHKYRNGLGDVVDLEDTYLYPMLKGSGVAKSDNRAGRRVMLVTQKTPGEPTDRIKDEAPRTWAYLNCHADILRQRASSIYRGRPAFSIFGIGDYSFAPWKVAISGFYKKLAFVTIGPLDCRPVVLDDTSYFLPCQEREQANYLAGLLNSAPAQSFYQAFVFWDSKRPITAELLRRLDLRRLAGELGSVDEFDGRFGRPENHAQAAVRKRRRDAAQLDLWPT